MRDLSSPTHTPHTQLRSPPVAVGNCPSVIRSELRNPLPAASEAAAGGVDGGASATGEAKAAQVDRLAQLADEAAASEAPGVDCGAEGLVVFMCDTSYSNIAKIAGGGPRGKAVSELVVLSDTQTSVRGELETGDEISYVIDAARGGDSHVGRELSQQLAAKHPPTEASESREPPVYVAARLASATDSKAYPFWPMLRLSTDHLSIRNPYCFGCC